MTEWAGLRPGRTKVRLHTDTCTKSDGTSIPVSIFQLIIMLLLPSNQVSGSPMHHVRS